MIRFSLEREGYQVFEAADARAARALAAEHKIDLMLIDWMLPDMSGPELIRRFRQDDLTRKIPMLMLTAKGEEEDVIYGLDAGADDYLSKPVSLKTLNARIKALLRRTEGFGEPRVINMGRLQLNQEAHQFKIDGVAVHLGTTEYRLLAFFMTHPERAYTRAQLLDQVWGGNVYIEDRTIDVHIRRLRKVLEPYAADRFVQTVRGTGYRFSTRADIALG